MKTMRSRKKPVSEKTNARAYISRRKDEDGFSLIETVIAMVVLSIALLGVVSVFAYSIKFNTGNNVRSQALAVLQQKAEQIRAAKFTPLVTDPTLIGGVKPVETLTAADNATYRVEVTVDDDPFTDGLQVDSSKTIKEITIVVRLQQNIRDNWVFSIPTSIVIRRVKGN